MTDHKHSALTKLVVAGAKARFGETRWQSPLAELIKMSPASIQKLTSASDPRDVTEDTARKVAMALIVEADKLEAQSEMVREAGTKIFKKLEGGK